MNSAILNKIDLSKIKFLSRNAVKFIAVICMVIDHAAYAFCDPDGLVYFVCRYLIGRMAFPMFVALFVDGFFRTKNVWKHLMVLLIFSVVSEPAFDLLFEVNEQNVMWNWALGWLMLMIFDKVESMRDLPVLAVYFCEIGFMVLFAIIATVFDFDYTYVGIGCMGLCYIVRKDPKDVPLWVLCAVAALLDACCYQTYGTLLSVPVVMLYDQNKKCRHDKSMKYVFYAFYPVHIIMIAWAATLFHNYF